MPKRSADYQKTKKSPAKKARSAGVSKSLINPPRPRTSQPEKKNIDVVAANPITFGQTTANVVLLNGMVYGNTATTHVGRKVRMTSVQWRFQGSGGVVGGATGSSPLRMVILYDKQTNGANAAAATAFSTDTIDSPLNLNQGLRFLVVADEIIPNVNNISSAGDNAWYTKGYKKINLPIEFNTGTAGTAADIVTGSLIAYFWQNGQLATQSPVSTCYFRTKFEDV